MTSAPSAQGGARPSAETIAGPLLEFLHQHIGPSVEYAAPPRYLADGVTARAFALRLTGVPPEMAGELVCRLFYPEPGSALPDQIPVEEALHNALAQSDYPVPRVFAACGADSPLDAPFMLMERVAGRDIFGFVVLGLMAGLLLGLSVSWLPLTIALVSYWGFMVRLLMRLHAVSGDAVLERMEQAGISRDRLSSDGLLDTLDSRVRSGGLRELQPLVDWLRANRPEPTPPPTICHGDFWLGNIMLGGGRATVLDWTQARVAQPELDLGWIEIQRYSRMPLELPISEWIYDAAFALISPLAWILLSANGLAYRLVNSVDRRRLRYYTVFNCSKVLIGIAALRAAGAELRRPRSPELIAWGSPRTVRLLARRVRRITGLRIQL